MLSKQAQRTLLGAGRKELARVAAVRVNARAMATPAAKPPSSNDPFANGTNAYYAEEMYRIWREDPKAVHASWDVYFSGMDKGLPSHQAFQPPPSIAAGEVLGQGPTGLHASSGRDLDDHMKVCAYMTGS
jgi:2-oxoglutarate dehydrogenase E1 component